MEKIKERRKVEIDPATMPEGYPCVKCARSCTIQPCIRFRIFFEEFMHKPCQPRVTTTSIIAKKAYREEHPERFLRKDAKEDISICLNCTKKYCSGSKRCLLKRKGEQNNVNPD